MKRLLAYLFLVLGLGLVFSINANAVYCKRVTDFGTYIDINKPNEPCVKDDWYDRPSTKVSIVSAYEYITYKLYSKNLTEKNINSNLYITEIALINKINSAYAELRYYGYNYKTLNEVVLKNPQLARYKPFLKLSKEQTQIAKAEPSQTQELAGKDKFIEANNVKAFCIDNMYNSYFKVKPRINKAYCKHQINLDDNPTQFANLFSYYYPKYSKHKLLEMNIDLVLQMIEGSTISSHFANLRKEPSQTQEVAKLKDIDITNTAWLLKSRYFVLFLKNGKCKINERGLDVIIRNISYEGAWGNYCKYKKHSNNRVELAYGNETNPKKYYLAFFENKVIGSNLEAGLKVFKEVLNGKKPRGIYVQGVKKELTATQIAKLPKKEPSQTQEIAGGSLAFCVQAGSTSSFGHVVTKLKQNSICEGKDFVVTKNNNEVLFYYLKKKYDTNKGLFHINPSYLARVLNKEEKNKTKKKVVKKEKKKKKVAKVEEPKQEEFKPEDKDIDNDAPVIEIAEAITVDSQAYTLKGKVKDKSKIYLTIDGRQVQVRKGKFKIDRFNIDPGEVEEIKIVAIDKWNNKTEKTIKVTIDLKSTELARSFEDLKPNNVKVKTDKNKIAIIIGIEKYVNLENLDAPFANRDAKAFRTYATRALGVKSSNIKLLVDDKAARPQILEAFKIWLPRIAADGRKDIYIFFSGHGLASDDGEDLYILPQNGYANLLDDTAITRVELISLIQKVNPKSVTMFFDTCYSGQTREERMLVASLKPIRIVAEEQDTPDNFTVFSASNFDQTSGTIKEAKQGMFSYYLMKGLEGKADNNKDKKITNGELIAYLKTNVSKEAFTQNREQDPMLSGDPNKVLMSYR